MPNQSESINDTNQTKGLGRSVGKSTEAQPAAVPLSEIVQPSVIQQRAADAAAAQTGEIGGPKGLEPTRYGDWERKGKCVDF